MLFYKTFNHDTGDQAAGLDIQFNNGTNCLIQAIPMAQTGVHS
jgi:hypothetical protein